MKVLLYIITFMLFICISCSKDKNPEGTIYVQNDQNEELIDIPVRFYVQGDYDDKSIDTTIYSDNNGNATLSLKNEAHLYAEIKYLGIRNQYYLTSTFISITEGNNNVDTLTLKHLE